MIGRLYEAFARRAVMTLQFLVQLVASFDGMGRSVRVFKLFVDLDCVLFNLPGPRDGYTHIHILGVTIDVHRTTRTCTLHAIQYISPYPYMQPKSVKNKIEKYMSILAP